MSHITKCRLEVEVAEERKNSIVYKLKKVLDGLRRGRPTLVSGPAYDMVLPGPPIRIEPSATNLPTNNQPATMQAATNQPTVNQPAPSVLPVQPVTIAPIQDQSSTTNQELGFSQMFSRDVADADTMTSSRRAAFLPGDLNTEVPSAEREAALIEAAVHVEPRFPGIARGLADLEAAEEEEDMQTPPLRPRGPRPMPGRRVL
ncbi:hypothetical protein BD626DRAFT_634987 [Schizophyllum amplum]|uniref:Uncharacterized protein n=1 Tax=Schizophyllum amplum TaxID=97359 RepID=A0A550BXG3_9AGAR|nr:hypothetical protein BD626DRAFT_634987 [Auriculariopsis ampla]